MTTRAEFIENIKEGLDTYVDEMMPDIQEDIILKLNHPRWGVEVTLTIHETPNNVKGNGKVEIIKG